MVKAQDILYQGRGHCQGNIRLPGYGQRNTIRLGREGDAFTTTPSKLKHDYITLLIGVFAIEGSN
jgi:hypothetical protein